MPMIECEHGYDHCPKCDGAKPPKRQEASQDDCKHWRYSQDRVTGECRCDDCGKLVIDSIGRVLD